MRQNKDEVTAFEAYGFEVDDGWLPLVKELVDKIEDLGVIVLQVKSKFGQLRCYITTDNNSEGYEKAKEIIREYEDKCKHTCEWCGSNDEVRTISNKGWLRTLCKKCQEKIKNND